MFYSVGIYETIGLLAFAVLWVILMLAVIASRYKKCPSDKIMVIYGNVGRN